jgi:hypothetical protein
MTMEIRKGIGIGIGIAGGNASSNLVFDLGSLLL